MVFVSVGEAYQLLGELLGECSGEGSASVMAAKQGKTLLKVVQFGSFRGAYRH